MASYRIILKTSAAKELEAVRQKKLRQRIAHRIGKLAEEPRPAGCEKLSDSHGLYRVRVGAYRIVYTVDGRALSVCIVKIGHRRDVYR